MQLLLYHKLELKNDNFFIRAYIVAENSGDAYDTRFAAVNTNRAWKSDTQWFTEYAQTFIGARLGVGTGIQATEEQAHAAARAEGIVINIKDIKLPETDTDLIVEGAGGLMVPLNDHDLMIDMPLHWNIPVVLVSNLYLGSINHTLLTAEALAQRNIEVKGIIFNGKSNPSSEEIILKRTGFKVLLRIPELKEVNKATVKKLSTELLKNWNE